MRRLVISILLVIIALGAGLPFLLSRQIPAKYFPGVTIVRLFLHEENRVVSMQMEDYLVGVVASEMPAEFPPDALKAQAVVARTRAVRSIGMSGTGIPLHAGADLCDDGSCCQAWLSRQELKRRWGTVEYYNNYYKVKGAVDETRGQVLAYRGELLDPVCQVSCGGGTENAEDVWGVQVPYLRGVPCPYDSEPNTVQTVSFSFAQLDQALGTSLAALSEAGSETTAGSFVLVEATPAGRPKLLQIGGSLFTATAVKDLLGLRSVRFTWHIEGDTVSFTTTGDGYGVGLCQYGAKGLAEHGYGYRTILGHYYSRVEIINSWTGGTGTLSLNPVPLRNFEGRIPSFAEA
jgi:stage II sporulation protein D